MLANRNFTLIEKLKKRGHQRKEGAYGIRVIFSRTHFFLAIPSFVDDARLLLLSFDRKFTPIPTVDGGFIGSRPSDLCRFQNKQTRKHTKNMSVSKNKK